MAIFKEIISNGDCSKTFKDASLSVLKEGGKGAAVGSFYYTGYRVGGEVVDLIVKRSPALSPRLANFMKTSSGKIAIIGGAIISVESIYDIVTETKNSGSVSEALFFTAKKQVMPVGLLGLTCVNPVVGIVASVMSLIYGGYVSWAQSSMQRDIEIYEVSCYYDKAAKSIK